MDSYPYGYQLYYQSYSTVTINKYYINNNSNEGSNIRALKVNKLTKQSRDISEGDFILNVKHTTVIHNFIS